MPPTAGQIQVPASATTLDFDLDQPGVLYAAIINFEPQSTVWGPVNGPLAGIFPELYEFRRVPPTLDWTGTSGVPVSLPNAAVRQFAPPPHVIRVQAIYLDFDVFTNAPAGLGVSALMASNEGGWTLLP